MEISQALAPGEEMPPIRRRVGTAYAINDRILKDDDDDEDDADENAAQVGIASVGYSVLILVILEWK